MRLNGRERAAAVELIVKYLEGLDDVGIYMLLGVAHSQWKSARKGNPGANQEAAAQQVRELIAAQMGGNIIPFPRR